VKETERCRYERKAFVAHQHSKYSVEGGRGSSEQKRNKNLPREQDVALIFIREKRGCCVEEREDEVGGKRGRVEMKCKCLNEPLRDYRGTS